MLAVPAIFFAAGFAPGMVWLEKRLPFWPAGWLVALTVVSVAVYGVVALLDTSLLSGSALASLAISAGLTIGTMGLLLFSALRQARMYRTTGLQSQADLVFAFVLLAEAVGLGELLEVCDESGKVRGYFHPIGEPAASAVNVQSPFSREELERRRRQRTGRPLAEVLTRLEQS